jgi:ubiquinone biosynthesis accessory factor UbiJ
MATSSPFLLAQGAFENFARRLQPPPWFIDEAQQRIVLLLNHVLGQEPEAMARLKRQAGRVVLFRWRSIELQLAATRAGLLERAAPGAAAELTLTVTEESPFELAQAAMRGDKPPVRIEGDVQLAAEVNWLADHVRWDLEEDVARVIGDAPAHAAGTVVRGAVQALRKFVGQGRATARPDPSAAPAAQDAVPAGAGPAKAPPA